MVGMGWQTSLIDFLMNTYPSFTFHTARRFPLATAILLNSHRRDVTEGGDSPQNPIMQAMIQARTAVRRHYQQNFTIVKT
jgi:hypothetical protein